LRVSVLYGTLFSHSLLTLLIFYSLYLSQFFWYQFTQSFGIMNELIEIDFSKKHFECEGRKFYLKQSLSFARYREMQKINLEFAYSASFNDIYKHVREAWDLLNATKLGEAAVVLHNVLYGIVSLEDKDDPALRLCALFIDEEGEDPTVYDEGKMREKIECWSKGGLSTSPFFQLAANLVPEWINVFQSFTRDGLQKAAEKEPQA
jgi:hypothetical protein